MILEMLKTLLELLFFGASSIVAITLALITIKVILTVFIILFVGSSTDNKEE